MTSPTPITGATPRSGRRRTRRRGQARCPGSPWEQEYGRDVWRLGKLGIDDRRPAHISFENIPQPRLKDLAKRWARWRLSTGSGAAAAAAGTRAAARVAAFPADPGVNAGHLGQVDRAVLEHYLARLHAELAGRVVHRAMIGQLNLFFTAIRQHGWDSTLPAHAMFFPEDVPKEGQRLPRALSERVMAQLDNAGNLARWSTPEHRLITVILMRCGLRIGDALRLPGDCLVRDADGARYLRYFNHKMDREALVPIDEELEHASGSQRQRLHDRWPPGTALPFPRATGNLDGRHPRGDQTYRRALRRWPKRRDIRDEHGQPVRLTPHQRRHTPGTQLINRDAPKKSYGRSWTTTRTR
jgi:integrase